MNRTSRRAKRVLVIAAMTAMAGAGALASAGAATADDHGTIWTGPEAAATQVVQPIGGDDHSTGGRDDHGTGGRDDHGTGGRDDHGTGGRDDHGTIWAGPDAAAAR
ncbi:hypothetical protein [Streptomyces abikoensis]